MTYGHSGDLAVILTAHTLGKAAYLDGLTLDDNPYRPEHLRTKWAEGWSSEESRARNGKAPTPMPAPSADNPRPSK